MTHDKQTVSYWIDYAIANEASPEWFIACSLMAQAISLDRQAAALERIAAAQEKEEQWVYNHYLKLDALVGEVGRIAAVLERADNLSKMFE